VDQREERVHLRDGDDDRGDDDSDDDDENRDDDSDVD
jgi:hypothetical protein